MYNMLKHFPFAIFGTVVSFITEGSITQSIPPQAIQQLINGIVSIIAGVLSALAAKWLHNYMLKNSNNNGNRNGTYLDK